MAVTILHAGTTYQVPLLLLTGGVGGGRNRGPRSEVGNWTKAETTPVMQTLERIWWILEKKQNECRTFPTTSTEKARATEWASRCSRLASDISTGISNYNARDFSHSWVAKPNILESSSGKQPRGVRYQGPLVLSCGNLVPEGGRTNTAVTRAESSIVQEPKAMFRNQLRCASPGGKGKPSLGCKQD